MKITNRFKFVAISAFILKIDMESYNFTLILYLDFTSYLKGKKKLNDESLLENNCLNSSILNGGWNFIIHKGKYLIGASSLKRILKSYTFFFE